MRRRSKERYWAAMLGRRAAGTTMSAGSHGMSWETYKRLCSWRIRNREIP
jgi:hypothetical protein